MRSTRGLFWALGLVALMASGASVDVTFAAPPEPKVLQLGGPLGAPSWLRPAAEDFPRWRFVKDGGQRWAMDPLLGPTWLLAWDERFLFVRTDRGTLVESRADGVLGFVPPPLRFAVYDPAGFVIVTRDEQTMRAPIARATEIAAYVPFGSGRVVDRVGTTWLAVMAGRLVRSGDGVTWEPAAPTSLEVRDARIRYDGTIVATTAAGLVVVTPSGVIEPASLQLAQPTLVRWGSWIVAAPPFELAHPEKALAVLGSDRKTWVMSKPPKDQRSAGFVQIVDNWLGYATRVGQELWPGAAPTKPPVKRPVRGAASALQDEVATMMAGPDGGDKPPCQGTDCFGFKTSLLMSGDQIPRFFPDARCDSASTCDHGPFARQPAIGIFDRRSDLTRVLRAPDACQPVGLQAARGLVLLHCKTRFYSLGVSGWVEELAPIVPPGNWLSYGLAEDGTLIVIAVGKDERPHAAWLRLPVELGAANAWREVTLPNALWYAPLPGGRAAVATSQDKSRLEVWEVDDEPSSRLAPRARVELAGQLTNIRLVDRNIVLTVGGESVPVTTR